jgi:hypothetical protein
MNTSAIQKFENLVRAYLAGSVDWNQVHNFAVEMEWENTASFPSELQKPLNNLHMAFLTADEQDESQFRLERIEIAKLVEDLDRAKLRAPGSM